MEIENDKKRANWGSQIEFILTLIGFAVGLGNVWRFPYLCFRNGGGAFLIPYTISLCVMGIPLFYMELCIGQFASLGPVKVWSINPALKGLGYSMVIVSALISFYYNVIIAVCVYFFFASMTRTLPWSYCDPVWASCDCRDRTMNRSDPNPWNFSRTECLNFNFTKAKSPSEDYFFSHVLKLSPNLAETGGISWQLVLCLLAAWLTVFLVLTKGIESLAKIVYVTAIFPYVLLTALLVRGLTLEGAQEGIRFYLTPNMSKLADAEVWSDAAVQIFYSLSVSSGGLIAMASYNAFNNNVLRDTFLVPIINCGTSFYAGFVIFSSLGFMAHTKGVEVKDVAAKGPGLAFVAYPEALSQMPVAPLWSILFFLMMMMLGFSSQFSIVETVLTGLLDELPSVSISRFGTILFRAGYCLLGFLFGLPMVTGAGFHLLDLVDNSVSGFPLLFVGLVEVIAIVYVYGFIRFRKDIIMMLSITPTRKKFVNFSFYCFAPMWCIFTPLCLLGIIVFKCIQYKPESVTNAKIYPMWADVIWWMITAATIIMIPLWFIAYYCLHDGCRTLAKANSPKPKWGPALRENRLGRYNDAYDRNKDLIQPYDAWLSELNIKHPNENGNIEATQDDTLDEKRETTGPAEEPTRNGIANLAYTDIQ
ncbi:sodium- and chloride-dependent glycine transporter 1-like [Dreissena polymorpha]|uniref:sodium- and chloride-dependent glycine transporter 1-like n=1 Tax=Dreissena polymorpha TaxID=45954 RepID=UPI00226511CB|nr:sodium- and chloride-dependent glycine transporter 1-like [Dreissena polymorpha]